MLGVVDEGHVESGDLKKGGEDWKVEGCGVSTRRPFQDEGSAAMKTHLQVLNELSKVGVRSNDAATEDVGGKNRPMGVGDLCVGPDEERAAGLEEHLGAGRAGRLEIDESLDRLGPGSLCREQVRGICEAGRGKVKIGAGRPQKKGAAGPTHLAATLPFNANAINTVSSVRRSA